MLSYSLNFPSTSVKKVLIDGSLNPTTYKKYRKFKIYTYYFRNYLYMGLLHGTIHGEEFHNCIQEKHSIKFN